MSRAHCRKHQGVAVGLLKGRVHARSKGRGGARGCLMTASRATGVWMLSRGFACDLFEGRTFHRALKNPPNPIYDEDRSSCDANGCQ